MIFDERLTELRKAKGLSQKECALDLGMPDASKYNKWENGANRPDYETVCQLAKYFDVTTDYLLGASDCKNAENHDIHEETGLSEKAVETLKHCINVDKRNSITLTVNTLLENRHVLGAISHYLYYEIDEEQLDGLNHEKQIIPYCVKYKYLKRNPVAGWGNDVKPQIDADTTVEALTCKSYKKLLIFNIEENLEKLLEQENNITHFEI
ncbi:MAG: helix-turn-helix transcriptional regulator [Bacillota bacterium]|nr:helix-turn-helix transcriptional regulator [Bacillota bacterium]